MQSLESLPNSLDSNKPDCPKAFALSIAADFAVFATLIDALVGECLEGSVTMLDTSSHSTLTAFDSTVARPSTAPARDSSSDDADGARSFQAPTARKFFTFSSSARFHIIGDALQETLGEDEESGDKLPAGEHGKEGNKGITESTTAAADGGDSVRRDRLNRRPTVLCML